MATTSNIMLNKSGETGHSFFVQMKYFQLFTFEYYASCGLEYMIFIMLKYVPLFPLCDEFLP